MVGLDEAVQCTVWLATGYRSPVLIRHRLMTPLRLVMLDKVREDKNRTPIAEHPPTVDIPVALLMYTVPVAVAGTQA